MEIAADLVEIIALLHGILLARDLQLSRVILESDALVAIQDINNKYTGSSSGHLIMDILHSCSSFESCSFQHISRDFNQVAHELAHYARRTGSSQLWMGVTPPFLSLLIHSDAC